METIYSSEMSVDFQRTIGRYVTQVRVFFPSSCLFSWFHLRQWSWRQCDLPKRPYTCTRLHGVAFQKLTLFIIYVCYLLYVANINELWGNVSVSSHAIFTFENTWRTSLWIILLGIYTKVVMYKLILMSINAMPITVAAWSKAWATLARTLGSWFRIPLEAWMSVCVYSVSVLFYV
jgi:hypothetical protein